MKVAVLTLFSLCIAPTAWGQTADAFVLAKLFVNSTANPQCTFSSNDNLVFGSAGLPSSGTTGSVTVSPVTGARSANNVTTWGTYTVGQVQLTGTDIGSYVVSIFLDAEVVHSSQGTETLDYDVDWAQAETSSGSYTSITGFSYSHAGTARATSLDRYFQFGGTIGGILPGSVTGVYEGSITVWAGCV